MAEVKTYHNSIGFTSLADSKYDDLDEGTLVTEAQLKDFMLDAHSLVQVAGTLFHVSDDSMYLLTLQAAALTDDTYASIAAGTFDAEFMNRFATGLERDETFGLFSTIAANPSGIDEVWPGGAAVTMKFWGWGDWTCQPCDDTGYQVCTRIYYVLWMRNDFQQITKPCVY
ncbi:MAG: hypothetical protein QM642_00420 [Edaphocola sp.]